MKTQNFTFSIPEEVLRKIKILAAKRQTSISHLLIASLERLIEQGAGYAETRLRQLRWLENGFNLVLWESPW